jgi:hypothetical protein
MSDADDRVTVRRHLGIVGQEAQRFGQGLGHKHAVEGIGVQVGEMFYGGGMLR